MCTALSHKTKITDLLDYFPFLEEDLSIEYNAERASYRLAFEYLPQPVIISEESTYKLRHFEWGVVASYMNSPELIKKGRAWMCNARAEKIFEKKSYWNKIRHQRCLVPVTGIYEHRRVAGMKNKIPYFVSMKDREVFFLPGLYNYSPIPDEETGELTGTFAIITRAANKLMEKIHNDGDNKFRMPLFLPKEMEQDWLRAGTPKEHLKKILAHEIADEELEAWPVYTLNISKPRPDHLSRYEPYHWPGLPALGDDLPGKQQTLF